MKQPSKIRFPRSLALGLSLVVVGSGSAQNQAPPQSSAQIRVTTNEVIAPVAVTNASGEFVLDLEQKDFQVFDDGAAQEIDHWDLGGDPLAVVLLIETSTHLHAFEPVMHRMGSIFTETVMALDGEAAVVTYDSTVDVRQSFTQDHDAVQKAIAETKFEAPEMRLYDAMAASVALLEGEPTNRRRIMLILGESQDSGSTANLVKSFATQGTQTSRSTLWVRAASVPTCGPTTRKPLRSKSANSRL